MSIIGATSMLAYLYDRDVPGWATTFYSACRQDYAGTDVAYGYSIHLRVSR